MLFARGRLQLDKKEVDAIKLITFHANRNLTRLHFKTVVTFIAFAPFQSTFHHILDIFGILEFMLTETRYHYLGPMRMLAI